MKCSKCGYVYNGVEDIRNCPKCGQNYGNLEEEGLSNKSKAAVASGDSKILSVSNYDSSQLLSTASHGTLHFPCISCMTKSSQSQYDDKQFLHRIILSYTHKSFAGNIMLGYAFFLHPVTHFDCLESTCVESITKVIVVHP